MANFMDILGAATLPLWLDATAYTARLLEGGEPPWLEVANFLAWQRKAQGLVRSDVVALPVEPVVAALLAREPQLATAMAAKPRALFPLKTLLAEAQLREQLGEMLAGLRACFTGTPLALVIPSPRSWIVRSHAQALGPGKLLEVGGDDIDSASMYVADFLRSFSEAGLDVLLLEEDEGAEPASLEAIEWYRPVLNVAMHYRWATGLRLPRGELGAVAVAGLDYCIAPQALDLPTGIVTPPAFWTGAAAPACAPGGFRHAQIPADASPEEVLERLALLRRNE